MDRACTFHPNKPANGGRGLCTSCYGYWRRGILNPENPEEYIAFLKKKEFREEVLAEAKVDPDNLPTTTAFKDKSFSKWLAFVGDELTRWIKLSGEVAQKAIWDPYRVQKLTDQFYKQAFKDNRVLLEYMKYILPQQRSEPPVKVVINTNLINKGEGKIYDVTGEVIEEN